MRGIKANVGTVEFAPMVPILIAQCGAKDVREDLLCLSVCLSVVCPPTCIGFFSFFLSTYVDGWLVHSAPAPHPRTHVPTRMYQQRSIRLTAVQWIHDFIRLAWERLLGLSADLLGKPIRSFVYRHEIGPFLVH